MLQQLCQLPFQYISDARLSLILFPTLIASCYQCSHNRIILEQELSTALFVTFVEVSDVTRCVDVWIAFRTHSVFECLPSSDTCCSPPADCHTDPIVRPYTRSRVALSLHARAEEVV